MDTKEFNEIIFDPIVCVKCGYCKSKCPTYLAKRDERFSPRGRLILSYKILKERENMSFFDFIRAFEDIDTCSKCGECEKTCPMDLKPYLSFMRAKGKTLPGKIEIFFAKLITKNRFLFSLSFIFASKMKKSKYKMRWIRKNPTISENIDVANSYPTTVFFPSCFGYTIFSDIREKAEKILKRFDIDFITAPRNFSCCGAPLLLAGSTKEFQENQKELIEKIKKEINHRNLNHFPSTILVLGPTCTWVMMNFYKIQDEFPGVKIEEVSDFILEKVKEKIERGEMKIERKESEKEVTKKEKKNVKVIIHKPCHEKYDTQDKVRIMKSMGFEVEQTDFPCCGFGGSMFFKYGKMSDMLLNSLLEPFEKDDVIFLSNSPGCILQISRKREAKHILEFIF